MRKKLIVKIDFCKTFGISNIINPIITPLVSYQIKWLDGNNNGLPPWSPRLSLVKISM
jgi:hypothetical protein